MEPMRQDLSVCSPWAEGIVSRCSPHGVDETVDRITQLLDDKGLTTFAVIDHSGEAERAGLELPNTKLVIFGSPTAGTPVMVASPLAAIDLPLKLLVWDDEGTTCVSYNAPEFLATRHHLDPSAARPLTAVEQIAASVVEE
jgi:uncharacterized protein (DUF302 family)